MMLLYELMAAERAAQYRKEAETDRRLRLVAGERRPAKTGAGTAVAQNQGDERSLIARRPGSAAPRRALAGAFLGFAAIGALRWRR